jgi:hypothetical protein
MGVRAAAPRGAGKAATKLCRKPPVATGGRAVKKLCLLCNLERIVNLDAEIVDCALQPMS